MAGLDPLGSITYGTPPEVAAAIVEQVRDAPVETVYLWASIAAMSEDLVTSHVRTICTELAPLLSKS